LYGLSIGPDDTFFSQRTRGEHQVTSEDDQLDERGMLDHVLHPIGTDGVIQTHIPEIALGVQDKREYANCPHDRRDGRHWTFENRDRGNCQQVEGDETQQGEDAVEDGV